SARLFRTGQQNQIRRWIFFDDKGISEGRISGSVMKRLELNKRRRLDNEAQAAYAETNKQTREREHEDRNEEASETDRGRVARGGVCEPLRHARCSHGADRPGGLRGVSSQGAPTDDPVDYRKPAATPVPQEHQGGEAVPGSACP